MLYKELDRVFPSLSLGLVSAPVAQSLLTTQVY